MTGQLYKISNIINDKCYIGKTYQGTEKRFSEHKSDSLKERNKNRPLYRAFNKYGLDNFKIETLGTFEEGELEVKEIEYIELYDSYKNGYNATLGGDGKAYLIHSDEDMITKYKELGSLNQTAKFFNCDLKSIKIRLESNNVKILSGKEVLMNNQGKKINQYSKDGTWIQEFETHTLAVEYLIKNGYINSDRTIKNIKADLIRCKNGKRKTAHNFIWKQDMP